MDGSVMPSDICGGDNGDDDVNGRDDGDGW